MSPGRCAPVEYKAFVADLVNYLDYMGEPVRNERINIGIGVLIYPRHIARCSPTH